MRYLEWAVLGFVSGSVPYAVLMGRLLARREVMSFGDGNPGAANAWRAGGASTGVPALVLDLCKGLIPVALARSSGGVSGWQLVPVALAPVLGHAFSPFLRFHGGKAVAVTFGVWTALTLWFAPTVFGLSLALLYSCCSTDAWSVVGGGLVLGLCLTVRGIDAPLLVIWLCNYLVLIWKHRSELTSRPAARSWIRALLGDSRK